MDRTSQLAALAERLERLQASVSEAEGKPVSDGDFARRYLPFSSTTLSRIRSADDPYTGSLDNITERLAQAEEDVAERLAAIKLAAASEHGFVQTKLARATQGAIKKARDSKLRRVVVLLAASGAGKSEIGKMLAAHDAIYIEGRQSWRKSYRVFCADIARVAGRPMRGKYYTEHDAEERMLKALSSRDRVLYIDEANTLSRESVNAIKLIVNTSGTVVVIAAIPNMWDLLCEGAEDEVGQLINRCQPILRDKGMAEADVRPFLARSKLPLKDVDAVLGRVTDEANRFGALRAVVALVDDLDRIDQPTHADVESMLDFQRKNVAQSGVKKGV